MDTFSDVSPIVQLEEGTGSFSGVTHLRQRYKGVRTICIFICSSNCVSIAYFPNWHTSMYEEISIFINCN